MLSNLFATFTLPIIAGETIERRQKLNGNT
jgi:hypothetical protein